MELTLRGEPNGMSLDWLPPLGVSSALAAATGVIGWLLAGARADTKVAADLKRAEELRLADLERAKELRAADVKRAEELRVADEKRAEDLRIELRDMKRAWDDGIDRVGDLAANMAGVQATQNQININSAKVLDSLAGDVERMKATLSDHSGSIQLLINTVMRK